MLLFSVPVVVGVILLAPSTFSAIEDSKWSSVLWIPFVPLLLPIEAAVYAAFGNTPGKWLCGIRVLDLHGQKIPFSRYLRRCFKLYFAGLGAGIPFVILVTLAMSYDRAAGPEPLSWDETLGTRSYRIHSGMWRSTLTAAVYLSMIGAIATANIALRSPENMLRLIVLLASRDLPTMADERTRLERVEAMPGLVLQYTFSLTDVDMNSPGEAPDEDFYQTVHAQLKDFVCADADAKVLRDLDVTFRHVFRDKNGQPLGQVQLASRDCTT